MSGDRLTPYAELADVIEALPLLVRERRRALGLSLRGAAAQLGCSQNTVTRIENDQDYNSRLLPHLLRWLDGAR